MNLRARLKTALQTHSGNETALLTSLSTIVKDAKQAGLDEALEALSGLITDPSQAKNKIDILKGQAQHNDSY